MNKETILECNFDDKQIIKLKDMIIGDLLKENEQLKEEIRKLKEKNKELRKIEILKEDEHLIISVGNIMKAFKLSENKKWISNIGDSNE